jgi:CHAT domain-containing protein/tetratricopeptide (TPR) repeat protein
MRSSLRFILAGFAAAVTIFVHADRASAISLEQAKEKCVEPLRPAVAGCVQRHWMESGPPGIPGMYLAQCKKTYEAQVRKCMQDVMLPGMRQLNETEQGAKQSKPQTPAAESIPIKVQPGLAAPPRTIADITAILDQEKPDPERIAKLHKDADDAIPTTGDAATQAQLYHTRAVARADLGRAREAIADEERAIDMARGKVHPLALTLFRVNLAHEWETVGEPKRALEEFAKNEQEGEANTETRGVLFSSYFSISKVYLEVGDLSGAERYVRKLENLWRNARGILGYSTHALNWEGQLEGAKARLFVVHGQFDDSIRALERCETLMRKSALTETAGLIQMTRDQKDSFADFALLAIGRAKVVQGRPAEGEADARRALLNRLQATGKYNPFTAQFVAGLGAILMEEGRYEEAQRLILAAIDIYHSIGVAEDSQYLINASITLASLQVIKGDWAAAELSYGAIEHAVQNWEPARREAALYSDSYIETLYRTRTTDIGLAAAEKLVDMKIARQGEKGFETAVARGTFAIGLSLANRDREAMDQFRTAVPLLLASSREGDIDDSANRSARQLRVQTILEAYIRLLLRADASDSASETFRLADFLRNSSVQKALAASNARAAARDPALADAARQAQDLDKQIGAGIGMLNNVLALPPDQRDEGSVLSLRAEIDKLRASRDAAKRDIAKRFPEYASLSDPVPPDVQDIQRVLRSGEAFLSIYFGREESYVWAVPRDGPVSFAVIKVSAADIDKKVAALRKTLEPTTSMLAGIPEFDLALAHELYELLLRPVEQGWKPANKLIVSTNGALGLLPLGLLPTEAAKVDLAARPYFVGYRSVHWLARTHSISMVPSASALITLRQIPSGSEQREPLVGFGDPIFNEEQAEEAQKDRDQSVQVAAATGSVNASEIRGLTINRRAALSTRELDSAGIGSLPRLPDTALELRSIAAALGADPSKALYLETDANEQNVKTIDLSRFRIVAFSTHGLLPGDLDGLTQPALALSAPNVAKVEGDGLLTTEEILGLKLNADWVVLSACNTAAGAVEGAEAVSGLGRAFFYAGSRALLVTNWSVHSESARELVSEVFRRQHDDKNLSRSEALRQAMLRLIDDGGFVTGGRTLFTYAHPWFWAPYSIVGDGG